MAEVDLATRDLQSTVRLRPQSCARTAAARGSHRLPAGTAPGPVPTQDEALSAATRQHPVDAMDAELRGLQTDQRTVDTAWTDLMMQRERLAAQDTSRVHLERLRTEQAELLRQCHQLYAEPPRRGAEGAEGDLTYTARFYVPSCETGRTATRGPGHVGLRRMRRYWRPTPPSRSCSTRLPAWRSGLNRT